MDKPIAKRAKRSKGPWMRTKAISLRLTPADYDEIHEAASRRKMAIAFYIRQVLMGEIKR